MAAVPHSGVSPVLDGCCVNHRNVVCKRWHRERPQPAANCFSSCRWRRVVRTHEPVFRGLRNTAGIGAACLHDPAVLEGYIPRNVRSGRTAWLGILQHWLDRLLVRQAFSRHGGCSPGEGSRRGAT